MTVCRARWEPPYRPRWDPEDEPDYKAWWLKARVFLCMGSTGNPDPCETHGCGKPGPNGTTIFYGVCRCPLPEIPG